MLAWFCGGRQLCQYRLCTEVLSGRQLPLAVYSNMVGKIKYGINIKRQLGRKTIFEHFFHSLTVRKSLTQFEEENNFLKAGKF